MHSTQNTHTNTFVPYDVDISSSSLLTSSMTSTGSSQLTVGTGSPTARQSTRSLSVTVTCNSALNSDKTRGLQPPDAGLLLCTGADNSTAAPVLFSTTPLLAVQVSSRSVLIVDLMTTDHYCCIDWSLYCSASILNPTCCFVLKRTVQRLFLYCSVQRHRSPSLHHGPW